MSQDGKQDSSMDMAYVVVALFIALILIKIWFGEDLAAINTQIRWFWLKVITAIYPAEHLVALRQLIETRHVRELSSDQLSQISSSLRFFMFPLFAAPIIYLARKVIKKNNSSRFRRRMDRFQLAEEMGKNFPWTKIALKQPLLDMPIDSGPWAMARQPLDFARRYGLLAGRTLDKRRAEKLFSTQLGKLWTGPKSLSRDARALFAVFAAQVCRDVKGADDALRELAISAAAGKLVYAQSDALLAKYAEDPRVTSVCNAYAYQYTVLIALFLKAKTAGILPPNHFLWLRPRDRTLWYTLNCVRRHTPFAMVSGIFSHYLAERVAGHRIERPCVDAAVEALDRALREIDFDPEPSVSKP